MHAAHLLPTQLRDNSDIFKHPPICLGGMSLVPSSAHCPVVIRLLMASFPLLCLPCQWRHFRKGLPAAYSKVLLLIEERRQVFLWLGCISVAVCGFLFVLSFIFLIYWKLTSLGKSLISKGKAIGAAIQRAQRAGLHFSITLRNATIR